MEARPATLTFDVRYGHLIEGQRDNDRALVVGAITAATALLRLSVARERNKVLREQNEVHREQARVAEEHLREGREARAESKRPDVRIVELVPGGADGHVYFTGHIQNFGTQPIRAEVTAEVAGQELRVEPRLRHLLANEQPTPMSIFVPRPSLGDLMERVQP
jgi:hypothetical protein